MLVPLAVQVSNSQIVNTSPTESRIEVDPQWAWKPFDPCAKQPWNLRWAGHLYRRAAFGATWKQLQQALADGPQKTVDHLLHPKLDIDGFDKELGEYESSAAKSESAEGIRAWWLRRMILTPHPLLEKMTLFWHGHFALSNTRVKNAQLMYQYICLLRQNAMGGYESLLNGISHNPAMLISLDSEKNRKAQPNENYARELLQSFGLGPSNFTENDVSETARAFTGWFVMKNQCRFIPREHDEGTKKILGEEGNFNSKDAIRTVLRQPAAPRFVIRKLYRWFISEIEEPSDSLIAPLEESFAIDYNIENLISTMLGSNIFFSQIAYRKRIKSPVEFALGIIQGLEENVSTTQLGQDLAALGQNLYHAPTIKGWQGGRHWINSSTLLGRCNLANALLSDKSLYSGKLSPLAIAEKHGFSALDSAGQFLLDLYLQGDLDSDVRESLHGKQPLSDSESDYSLELRQYAHQVFSLPEFQLA
jgi:uncharacterized protein DUF1800